MKQLTITLALTGLVLAFLPSCDRLHAAHDSQGAEIKHDAHAKQDPHAKSNQHAKQDPHAKQKTTERSRPTNQVAVMTVWAEAEKIAATAKFYEDILGLHRKGTSTSPYILDTDGTFVAIMEGKLTPPQEPKRRWPMFALSVPNLEKAVKALRDAKVKLPWGIEEFGAPKPSSRYVMFRDPAGNLIEIVQWL